ncbi:MAG: iron chelate uptake ABC transporter family permease subunit, partial [Exilispira sp.]
MLKARKLKFLLNILLFFIITLFIFFLRITIGNSIVSLKTVVNIIFNTIFSGLNFFGSNFDENIIIIIKSIRIPLFFSSFIIGATLSVSGLVMQIILKNPLAEPYTLGISSGASFGCSFAIFLSSFLSFKSSFLLIKIIPAFAIFFGILAAIIIFLIAVKTKSYSSSSLIISGIIVNSFFTAGITILFYLLGQK